MASFGENLKKIRTEKNITQQALAEKLYVTRQAVSRWETGARYPDLITAKKISDILGVKLDELLQEEDINNYESIKRSKEQKILTALFIMAILPKLIVMPLSIKETIDALSSSPYFRAAVYSDIVIYIYFAVISVLFFILHIKNRLNEKHVGIGLSVYYGVLITQIIAIYINNFDRYKLPLWNILQITLFIVIILIMRNYFVTEKLKTPIPVYICILIRFLMFFSQRITLYTLINQGIVSYKNQNNMLFSVTIALIIFASFIMYAFVFYYTYLTANKRLISNNS